MSVMTAREPSQKRTFTALIVDDQGQAATEYILLIGLIVLPLAIAYNKLRTGLKELFDSLGELLRGPGV